jgi:probable rRNA maturation factor
MQGESTFSVTTTLKSLPRPVRGLPFEEVKDYVLGKRFEVSLTFIGDKLSRRLNNSYRGKDKPTNVLSFNVSDDMGEIFINLKKCKVEAKKFDKTFPDFVLFLFIHGLLHLKGMQHGDTMEKAENKTLEKFQTAQNNGKTNRNRH